MLVHKNDTFEVFVWDDELILEGIPYDGFYIVVNRETGVTEYKTPSLGDAIVYAENSMRLLKNKPWEWVDKAAAIHSIPTEEFN